MKNIIKIILIYCCVGFSVGNWDIFQKERLIPDLKQTVRPFEKCSRRFSPGKCKPHVVSVWTYLPVEQNCTERFGCKYFSQGNRFATYAACMTICTPLIRMYNAILNKKKIDESAMFAKVNPESFIEQDSTPAKSVTESFIPKWKKLQNDDKFLKNTYKWTDKNTYLVDKIFGQVFQDIDIQGFPLFYKTVDGG